MTDQIIYVKDPPPLLREKFCLADTAALDQLSTRLNSIRKTSIDVTSIISDGDTKQRRALSLTTKHGYDVVAANGGTVVRRPVSGKHYSLSIEAPITKVRMANSSSLSSSLSWSLSGH